MEQYCIKQNCLSQNNEACYCWWALLPAYMLPTQGHPTANPDGCKPLWRSGILLRQLFKTLHFLIYRCGYSVTPTLYLACKKVKLVFRASYDLPSYFLRQSPNNPVLLSYSAQTTHLQKPLAISPKEIFCVSSSGVIVLRRTNHPPIYQNH